MIFIDFDWFFISFSSIFNDVDRFSLFFHIFTDFNPKPWVFKHVHQKVSISLDVFAKSIKKHWFLKVIFQNACVFSSGEPRGTRGLIFLKRIIEKTSSFQTFSSKSDDFAWGFCKKYQKTIGFWRSFFKMQVFFHRGNPAEPEGKSVRTERVSYHMEVRTLLC